MKIIIFDDNKNFATELKDILTAYLNEKNIYDFQLEAIHEENSLYRISLENGDVIFLDISTDTNADFGIDAAQHLREKNGECYIIFITSHGDKIRDALSGLICPAEFLTKPLRNTEKERLYAVMDAILEKSSQKNIDFHVGNTIYSIPIRDILYIQKENRKTAVYTQNQCLLLRETFSGVFEKLDESFAVIDKGTAVNVDEISAVNPKKRFLYLKTGKELYYARDRAKDLKRYLIGKEIRK